MPFNTQQRLMGLGVPTPMAKELGTQMDSGSYNWSRLMNIGFPLPLAQYLALNLGNGTFVARRAVELSMTPAVASLIGGMDLGTVTNALSPLKKTLRDESSNFVITVPGDSTGNSTTEFIYLWFQWLATLYPRVTFVYYGPDGAGGYIAPVTIQTGTGARTCTMYNASAAGKNSQFFMGGLFNTTFAVAPNLILWNQGKNHATVGVTTPMVQGEMMAAVAQAQIEFPSANHVLFGPYRNRDDSLAALANTCWASIIARDPTIGYVDLGQVTLTAEDFADNVHATDAANLYKLFPYFRQALLASKASDFAPSAPWLNTTVANLLANGDFSLNGVSGSSPGAATGGVPFGWTNNGTIAYTQETTIKYKANARSQKMQGSGTVQTRISRGATVTGSLGQEVFMTAIEYIAPGAQATVGRAGFSTNGTGSFTETTRGLADGQGGWRFAMLGPCVINAAATLGTVTAYHDSAGTPSSGTPDAVNPVYFQKLMVTQGPLPRMGT